jgi:2-amino-4-hydroxy-6-hydroxymethyldihydropteridine diphosphokinase
MIFPSDDAITLRPRGWTSQTPHARPRRMILIGIGASLPAPDGRAPRETCRAAAAALDSIPGLRLRALSRWWESAPVPPMPGAPWFVNGVARLEGEATPEAVLDALQALEARFGRERPYPNAPRTLDLDLLDHVGRVMDTPRLTLPHPRMTGRAFVLLPLAEVAPGWRHPVTGEAVHALIAALPDQKIRAIAD